VLKRLIRSDAAQALAGQTIAFYIRLVHATSRWQTRGSEHPQSYWDGRQPFIGAFWHGRLLMMPLAWTSSMRAHVLISQHRDGELIARAMAPFGLGTVRGSAANKNKTEKEKGGLAALREMRRLLKIGECICITPDGPRGPRMQATTGIVALARIARVMVLPTTYSVRRARVLRSWDRFLLPSPFNRGIFLWGEPMDFFSDADETLEQAALRLETAMIALCNKADDAMGRDHIAPAPRDPSLSEQSAPEDQPHAARA
jgi:lysophospholipid acyltransferase (LPLAT)-like uncharacterized protein